MKYFEYKGQENSFAAFEENVLDNKELDLVGLSQKTSELSEITKADYDKRRSGHLDRVKAGLQATRDAKLSARKKLAELGLTEQEIATL